MLEIDGSLGFPGAVVLPDLHWRVGTGEAVALVGANGSGKTTMLRSVAGILAPRAGLVLLDGIPASSQRSRRVCGYAPDPPPLYEELTAWEHLELLQRLWRGAVTGNAVNEVIEQFALTSYLHQRCDSLSLGMRKRVGVALAVLHRPTLLLLDEPFNGLDAAATRRLVALLERHVADGGTVVVSTHRTHAISDILTRVTALADGRLVYDGPIDRWNPSVLPEGGDGEDEDKDDNEIAEPLNRPGGHA